MPAGLLMFAAWSRSFLNKLVLKYGVDRTL